MLQSESESCSAAAAAKSLHSCPTLCDPIGRQPTRLPLPWDSPGKNTGVGCHCFLQCMKVKSESEVAQSCPTLSDPKDCSPPGSSVHGIFQARVLEWGGVPLPSPGDLPDPGIEPRSPALQADALPSEPPGKPQGRPREALGPRKYLPLKAPPLNLAFSQNPPLHGCLQTSVSPNHVPAYLLQDSLSSSPP